MAVPDIQKITSTSNPLVRETARLLLRKDKADPRAPFVIEGPNLVEAALRGGSSARVTRLFFTSEFTLRNESLWTGLLEAASSVGVDMVELSSQAMERISDTGTPQGVAAVATLKPVRLEDLNLNKGVVVVVDGVSDPGNLGTIIRTADASGASAVVLLDGATCDALGPKALRASAGSVFNLPIVFEKRATAVSRLQALGLALAVTSPLGGVLHYEADLRPPLAIVLGNERAGVGPEIAGVADLVLSIPVRGGAESLNVSAAAAVLLYEGLRQSAVKGPRGG